MTFPEIHKVAAALNQRGVKTLIASILGFVVIPLGYLAMPSFLNAAHAVSFTINCSGGGSFTIDVADGKIPGHSGAGCSGTATIPLGITGISRWAFTDASDGGGQDDAHLGGPTSIVFPASGFDFLDGASLAYTRLTSIDLPSSITMIGPQAFQGNSLLETATIRGTTSGAPLTSGYYIFNETRSLKSVNLGTGAMEIGWLMFAGSSIETVTGGTGVRSIGDQAFQDTPLRSITISNTVTTIGSESFKSTALTSIDIPNSVTSIGNQAFLNASTLQKVSFGTARPGLTSINSSGNIFTGTALSLIQYCGLDNPAGSNTTFNTYLTAANLRSVVGCSNVVPTTLQAVAADRSATISFDPWENGGAGITNYKYSLDGVSYTAFSPARTTSPLTISGLTNGTSYSVTLKAVNAQGDSRPSESVTVTPFRTEPVIVPPPPPMTPESAPGITFSNTQITCSPGKYSQKSESVVYTLLVGDTAVSTHFSNAMLPVWLVPWAGKIIDYGNATTSAASWDLQAAWKGKTVSCITLAYANHATGSTSVTAVVPTQ